MKPPPFSYHDPATVSDAVGLLSRLDNAKLLAGGQSLMPMLNMRFVLPDHIIDLNKVEGLSYITRGQRRARDRRHDAPARSRILRPREGAHARCMHEAIHACRPPPDAQPRHHRRLALSSRSLRRTRRPSPLALDATVTAAGPKGTREIAFADFPVAYMTPAIELNEIVTAIRFPAWPAGHGYGFVEFARRHGDFAIVSAAALLEEDSSGKITRASVTIGGVAVAPVRACAKSRRPSSARSRRKMSSARPAKSCRKLEALADMHAPASLPAASRDGDVAPRAGWRAHKRVGRPAHDGKPATSPSPSTAQRYDAEVEVRLTLADFMRQQLGLTGTHLGCEHGVCGACTILLDGLSARSCLMLAVQADGHEILTVEGIAPSRRQSCIRCRRRSATITACNAASARRAC